MSLKEDIESKLYEKNQYGYSHQAQSPQSLDPKEMAYLRRLGLKETYTYPNGVQVPIHPTCLNCQARHLMKYQGHPDTEKKPIFDVTCKGIPGALLPGTANAIKKAATEKGLSQERAELLFKSAIDPVAWAELMFGYQDGSKKFLRWYQKELIRCSAQRMVARWGRRSGKTHSMAIKLLYYAFNLIISRGVNSEGIDIKKGPKIIVTAPFQAQLTNIFDELEELLKSNEDLMSQVLSRHAGSLYIKSPFFQMEFQNGAIISGFVTGVEVRQDGSAGGSMRGQNAHIIYVDEMDMIPVEVLEKVIMPILMTAPDTLFFATSTPIGKAGKFYDLCKNRLDFKEMYLPSTVIPFWEQAKKEVEYSDTTDDGFIAEYMAEFVESSSGVFKAQHVYNAMRNYTYEDTDPDNSKFWNGTAGVRNRASDLVTVIGIDWNKNAGSEFVVVRYDQLHHKWWVAEAKNISSGKFDSVAFKNEVWRLNFKWKPDFIYADEGYGHHIIDDIHYEAHRLAMWMAERKSLGEESAITLFDQSKMKLTMDRLKKFNFSQKVELRNPVDGTPFERTGKEFLVENAIRVFEEQAISFPANDAVLRSQMLNYIVERRHASNGRPVYGMKQEKIGDHRLDALMLALGGIFLERNPFYSPTARQSQSTPSLMTKEFLEKRAHHEEEGPTIELIPGVGIEITRFQRGANEQEDIFVRNLQKLEESMKHTAPFQKPHSRSEFPTRSPGPHQGQSVFAEMWARAPSSAGYDDDTRPLYEARNAARSQGSRSSNGGLSIARQPRIRRTRGSFGEF